MKMFAAYFNLAKERNGHIEAVDGKLTISEAMAWCKGQAKDGDAFFAYTATPSKPHYASQLFRIQN